MRLAFSTSPQRTTWDWLLEVWTIADELPVFESGWTFDHLYPLFGDSTEDCLDGWMALAALLHETSRLRGGVLVSGMVYRHPSVLANMASTLDITSGGRLELGVGAGWNEEECGDHGIELGTMRERFDRFAEGLAVLEGLFTNDRTDFDGHYYRLRGAMNNPKPIQRPLPICIGGSGLRRTMPLVARYAHHWNFVGDDPARFAECLEVLRRECDRLGRDADSITRSVLLVGADLDSLAPSIASWERAGAHLAIVSVPKHEQPDFIAKIADAVGG